METGGIDKGDRLRAFKPVFVSFELFPAALAGRGRIIVDSAVLFLQLCRGFL